MGTICGHACYRGKPTIAIQLNLSFQMSCRLQGQENKKRHENKKT